LNYQLKENYFRKRTKTDCPTGFKVKRRNYCSCRASESGLKSARFVNSSKTKV